MLGGEGSDDWLPGVFVRNPTLGFDHGVKNRGRNVYGERGYACLDRGLDLGTGLESSIKEKLLNLLSLLLDIYGKE